MNLIKKILSDTDRKLRLKIFQEILILISQQKNMRKALDFYASNLIYKKDAGDLNNYVPNKTLWRIRSIYNRKEYIDNTLLNKIEQIKYLNVHSIPTANFIGELKSGKFIDIQNNTTQILALNDVKEIATNILKTKESVFFKPVGTSGGDGIVKLNLHNLDEQLLKINLQQDYIIEETLIQHDVLSAINPNCINTLRIFTFRKENQILVPGSFLRMGVGESFMDNTSQGSIFITYDIDSNQLSKVAYNHFRYGGESFFEHPDTNFIFDNRPLVYPDKIKSLVQEAALLFETPLLGWDIAFTPNGPKVIEVNHNPGVIGMQISMRGVLSNPIFKEVYDPKFH